MKKQLIRFVKNLFIFSLVLFLIQYGFTSVFLEEIDLFYSVPIIYLFHIVSTFAVYAFLLFIYSWFPDKAGFAFMGGSLLKMFAAVLFLLPMLLSDAPNRLANILSFFIPYFLYLAFETLLAVRLINSR